MSVALETLRTLGLSLSPAWGSSRFSSTEALLAAAVAAPSLTPVTLPTLPDTSAMVSATLPGPYFLCVVAAVDVGNPLGVDSGSGGGKRCLKLALSDGHREAIALEDEPLPTLVPPFLGAKLIVRDVAVRRGLLLLKASGVRVLGGARPAVVASAAPPRVGAGTGAAPPPPCGVPVRTTAGVGIAPVAALVAPPTPAPQRATAATTLVPAPAPAVTAAAAAAAAGPMDEDPPTDKEGDAIVILSDGEGGGGGARVAVSPGGTTPSTTLTALMSIGVGGSTHPSHTVFALPAVRIAAMRNITWEGGVYTLDALLVEGAAAAAVAALQSGADAEVVSAADAEQAASESRGVYAWVGVEEGVVSRLLGMSARIAAAIMALPKAGGVPHPQLAEGGEAATPVPPLLTPTDVKATKNAFKDKVYDLEVALTQHAPGSVRVRLVNTGGGGVQGPHILLVKA